MIRRTIPQTQKSTGSKTPKRVDFSDNFQKLSKPNHLRLRDNIRHFGGKGKTS